MTEFPHLYPGAGKIAALSAEERIHRIRADRWISYPRAEAALEKLETLMSFPERARMPNLLIVGDSGMGKTMIIEKFTRDHASSFDEASGRLHMPVVAVQMVSGPDESRFYRRILASIGAPEPPRATLSVLESLALRLLAELRPGMLVIDEIHSLQAGTIREQARFLNMLRFPAVSPRASFRSSRSWRSPPSKAARNASSRAIFWAATGCRRSWESRCDGARAPAGCLRPRHRRTAVFLGCAHGPVLRHDGFGIRCSTWPAGAGRVRPGMAAFGRAGGPDRGPHRPFA
jgi:hypothetical protein